MSSISTCFKLTMESAEQIDCSMDILKGAIDKLSDDNIIKNQFYDFLKECKSNQRNSMINIIETFALSYCAFFSLFPDIYKTIAKDMPDSSFSSETHLTQYDYAFECGCKAELKMGKLSINMWIIDDGVKEQKYNGTVSVSSLSDFEIDLNEDDTYHSDLVYLKECPDFLIKEGVLKHYFGLKTKVVIPDEVLVIGSKAFEKTDIESVKIGNNVTEIKDSAFINCKQLIKVEIGENVNSIGKDIFSGCSKLVDVTVKKKNKSYCSSGECLIAKSTKTLIYGNKNSIIPIDGSVEEIADGAFKLRQPSSITIPKSVLKIGQQAFTNVGLKKINIEAGNPKYCVIDNCLIDIETKILIVAGADGKIPSDGNVRCIGDYAFSGGNVKNIEIPSCIESVGDSVFENCKKLEKVILNNGTINIGDNAFSGCCNLREINIPNSVTTLGKNVFKGCKNLINVEFGNSLITIEDGAFLNCEGLIKVFLPDSIAKTGSAIFKNCKQLQEVELGGDEFNVGREMFSKCEMLKCVKLRRGTKSINYKAFELCHSLERINIPDTVTDIEGSAFAFCSILKSIDLPNSIRNINDYAFYDCKELVDISLPDGLISIGMCAFSSCKLHKVIEVPDSVINIGGGAFSSCKDLKIIEVSSHNTAFYVENSLLLSKDGKRIIKCFDEKKEVEIPNGVEMIDDYAFEDHNDLISMILPDSVRTIGKGVFWGCGSLKNIIYKGTKAQWRTVFKGEYWDGRISDILDMKKENYIVHCVDGDE